MKKMLNGMKGFFANEEGQGMVEYGLIIALVAVGAVVAITAFGDDIGAFFTGLGTSIGIK